MSEPAPISDDDEPDVARQSEHPRPRPAGPRARIRRGLPISEILFVFRARLKQRAVLGQELIAVLGIAVGVALLFASQVASQSLDGSVRQLSDQLVGATQYQLDSRGPEGFPEQVARKAGALPGVSAALPLLVQQAIVIGPTGRRESVDLIGADPRFAHLGGPLLRKFTARQLEHQRIVVLPEPIAQSIGSSAFQDVRLQIGTSTVETLLGATLSTADAGGLADSQIALAPLSYAQALAGMQHRVSRVFIKVKAGKRGEAAAGLRRLAAAYNLDAAPADFDAQLFSVAAEPAQQGETLFSVISAVVGFLFAFNAMLLTLPERRQLIKTMRRRGCPRMMVAQTLIFDALVIGALASALGLVLGELLSTALFNSAPGYLAFAFPVGGPRVVGFSTIALSIAAGFLAAIVGVLAPLRHILARPLRPQIELERQPRGWSALRLAAGFFGLLITTLIVLLRPQSAFVGVITLVIAGLALLPFLFRGIVLAFVWAQRPLASSATRLAVAELTDTMMTVRSLAVASTGALAVFGTVAVAGAQHNVQSGLNSASHEWNRAADIWVYLSGDDNSLATTPFPASVASRLEHVEDVRSVAIYRGSFLNVGDHRVWVIAPPRQQSAELMPQAQLTEGNASQANTRLRGHGWAVLSEAVAHELHLHLGESFVLPSPRPTTFRVAGLSTNGGWPPGAIVINAEDYAHAWGSNAASALNIQVAAGRKPAEARLPIIRALGPNSGLAVQTASEREAQWERLSSQGLSRLTQIKTIVLIAAILAMAFVMISLIWQRRQRIAFLKRTGCRKGLLWRALLFESGVLLGSGCLIGAVAGLYGQLVISHALIVVTGFPITISVGVTVAIISFLIVTGTALAIVAIPGYLATRVRATMVKPA
jgi:putative ABC transport system permease protein